MLSKTSFSSLPPQGSVVHSTGSGKGFCESGACGVSRVSGRYWQEMRAARTIEKCYRAHLKNSFPVMLRKRPDRYGTRLKNWPKVREKSADSYTKSFKWGARDLRVDYRHLLGEGRSEVYLGLLEGKKIAVKIGHLPELDFLEPLLIAQESGIRMVVPLPVRVFKRDLWSDEPPTAIAVMPIMDCTLADYLDRAATPVKTGVAVELNRLCAQADTLIYQLEQVGIIHQDAECNENFLIKDGQLYVGDFGHVKILRD